MAACVFLEEHDFSGKTIVPFCAHEEEVLWRSVTDIAKLCPTTDSAQGLAIRGGEAKCAKINISEWLRTLETGHGRFSAF